MSECKVSVCIPVYGVEKYVERCARSLFAQTMADGIEFIFVDDCSPDRSVEIIRRVLEEFPSRKDQVRILRHERNGGLVRARKTALAAARGDYVVHCDSDDWVDPDLYGKMHAKIAAEGADVVFCRLEDTHAGRNEPLGRGVETETDPRRMILGHLPSLEFNAMWNKMYARAVACDPSIEYPDDVSMGEDVVYTPQAIARCRRIAHLADSCRYHYVVNPASITGSQNRRPERARSLARVAEVLMRELTPRGYGEAVDRVCRDVLLAAVKCGRFTSAEYRAWRARVKGPLLGDCRHGFVKKAVLATAAVSYRLAAFVAGRLMK